MEWYIQKVGHTCSSDANVLTLAQRHAIKENKPAKFHYRTTSLVSDGPPSELQYQIEVCEDPQDKGAPLYRNSGMWYIELRPRHTINNV